ncbi:hypothetical protein OROHE_003179 [Orobanche hederae]
MFVTLSDAFVVLLDKFFEETVGMKSTSSAEIIIFYKFKNLRRIHLPMALIVLQERDQTMIVSKHPMLNDRLSFVLGLLSRPCIRNYTQKYVLLQSTNLYAANGASMVFAEKGQFNITKDLFTFHTELKYALSWLR